MIKTLSGSNEFTIESELKNIISDFVKNNGDLAIEQIDGSEADIQSITEVLTNLSFLYPNRLIILKKGSLNKQFIDSAEKILSNIPPNNEVVIVEPNIDKRLSYYKLLKKNTDFKDFSELDFGQLSNWVLETTSHEGGHIANNDARYLVELAGTNQNRLFNEITKLISYKPEITRQSINLLVEPISQATIFQLLDAVFSGSNKELLKIYDELKLQKIEPQQIIAMLTWQIHVLALINSAGNKSPAEISKDTKINPYVINKSIGIAKNLSRQDIRNLTSNLLNLDIKLKSLTIDIDEALLQLLLSIQEG
jgi:DNA polymerase III delta subunit